MRKRICLIIVLAVFLLLPTCVQSIGVFETEMWIHSTKIGDYFMDITAKNTNSEPVYICFKLEQPPLRKYEEQFYRVKARNNTTWDSYERYEVYGDGTVSNSGVLADNLNVTIQEAYDEIIIFDAIPAELLNCFKVEGKTGCIKKEGELEWVTCEPVEPNGIFKITLTISDLPSVAKYANMYYEARLDVIAKEGASGGTMFMSAVSIRLLLDTPPLAQSTMELSMMWGYVAVLVIVLLIGIIYYVFVYRRKKELEENG